MLDYNSLNEFRTSHAGIVPDAATSFCLIAESGYMMLVKSLNDDLAWGVQRQLVKHDVRVILIDGVPWFVAADVCSALGLSNVTQALSRLDNDEQALISNEGIHRGSDQVNVINESGLYSLILTSRKAAAKRFKKWVTADVLPSILSRCPSGRRWPLLPE